ncbi:glycosyltransferase [Cytobacillus sp. S13-E01]|uniref:MGDG synthase family glycosyltransferase n=1 Tax=Cytobacillus sp. S13-E01 TaxID=3031326 RepID=UPI0023D85683|nr:glycosyltransferase [Cytobacillus sp. S13-E01]MDF0727101.1 glycosyltransferase [Cytobacillus sp. S13-E01]
MKKILLFPLLDSLPSGHHQVASAITGYVSNRSTDIECKKIDLLNSWNPVIESMITKTYLRWIQRFPNSYAWMYRKFAYQSKKQRSYKHYDLLFLNKMERIITKEKPDLIICTHAFPSYLVNNLKKSGACKVPTLNIYTDFFINDVWGREMVDYHFVSDSSMKSNLMSHYSLPERRICTTGIPIDESFSNTSHQKKPAREFTLILTGGSAGLGKINELLKNAKHEQQLKFYVLCGNNKQLFDEIAKLNDKNIHPLPYISSRKQMNDLYNLADAIITKPGGVTISEAIKKKVPIFIHSALPGQEEINLKHLKEQGLVFTIKAGIDPAEQILEVLSNEPRMMEYQRSLQRYLNTQDFNDPEEIFLFIESILATSEKDVQKTLLKIN